MSSFVLQLIKFFSWFIYILPRRAQLSLGCLLGVFWFDILRIRRTVVLNNLRIAFPEYSESKRIKIGRSSLVNLCQAIVEYSVMIHYKSKDFEKYFVVEDLSELKRENEKGKGVLILTLHLGNGDINLIPLAAAGFKVNLISKHFKAKWLDDFWFGTRESHGVKFISHTKSSFDILKALKRNEIVVFVLDQFMGPPVGCRTKFFGKDTGTAMGLAVFAQKTGCPVVPVYNFRREDGRFGLKADEKIPFEEFPDKDETIRYMTQKYTDKIEQLVREYPEQWMWLHKRWKQFNDS